MIKAFLNGVEGGIHNGPLVNETVSGPTRSGWMVGIGGEWNHYLETLQ